MAEIVLPLLGLGALYVLSNKKERNSNIIRENFNSNNNKQSRIAENLPNTNVPDQNYPANSYVSNTYKKDTYPIDNTSGHHTHEYLNPNQTTDKFFNNDKSLEVQINSVNGINTHVDSLTGDRMDMDKFKHNNMVPFFGSNGKGASADHAISNVLDNLQGSGTTQIKKVEQAPMFKPDDNIQYNYGAPNQTDFFRSRELPSNKISNVLPWAQEKVGPGIGLGFTTAGAGGFNSGMMDREAWQAQTVDEMRVKTNPKISYTLDDHQGPAQSRVQNRGDLGEFEKHGPTTDFALGPQYWLTGNGATKAASMIPEQMMHDGNRMTTSSAYYGTSGTSGESKVSYVKGQYEASQRPEYTNSELNPAAAMGHGAAGPRDYGIDGYNIPKNNRVAGLDSRNNGAMIGINGALKAVMAPLMDALRPSRKENIMNNASLSGSIRSSVPSLPLTNPTDRLATTMRDTTGDKVGMNYLNVSHLAGNQGGGGYEKVDLQIKEQERNTGDSSTRGYIGGTTVTNAPIDTYAWSNQRNNVNKTQESWPMQGGTSMFNSQNHITMAKRDTDRVNNRLQAGDYVQHLPPSLVANIPSADTFGKINMPQQYSEQVNSDRMDPDILSAFKSNPYAKSLNSF